MSDDNTGATATRCSRCDGVHLPAECPIKGARVGTVLEGKYTLVRLLGEGGMGEVYEARHTKIGRRAAVKFLHGEFARKPEAAQRFENEARAAGEVEHENIAGVYDVGGLPDGTQYLVMEFLDGEDLDGALKRERRLPLARAADILMQACLGLEVVHRRGIVHRDLKPANLFLTKRANGTDLVKILDFGIAKLRRPEGNVGATGTGVALGTPYYMSPEQARGDREIGPRSDVYALGVIFYELLSGRRPHDGDSLLQILHHILTQAPTPLEELCPGLGAPVYRTARKAMARNVADRFAGVGELGAALAPLAGATYRPSQRAPMEVTRAETGGEVRFPGTEHLSPAADRHAQSVVGVARSAEPARRRVRSAALVVSAAAVVAIAAEVFLWRHGKGGAAQVTSPASAAVTSSVAAPPTTAPPPSTTSSAASAPPPQVSGTGVSGREEASRHPESAPAAPEPRKNRGSAGGPSLAQHATAPALASSGPARGSSPGAPTGSATSTKPDCTQTYTIDSEGNKHFRPECFQIK